MRDRMSVNNVDETNWKQAVSDIERLLDEIYKTFDKEVVYLGHFHHEGREIDSLIYFEKTETLTNEELHFFEIVGMSDLCKIFGSLPKKKFKAHTMENLDKFVTVNLYGRDVYEFSVKIIKALKIRERKLSYLPNKILECKDLIKYGGFLYLSEAIEFLASR